MSVIVKGMDMPKNCDECIVNCEHFIMADRRNDACPLVEIPTPHGRLVDVDDFMRHLISNVADLRTLSTGTIGKALHETPTIIEAEGGET